MLPKTILMRVSVNRRGPAPGRWKAMRALGVKRARVPGYPWFRCITNRLPGGYGWVDSFFGRRFLAAYNLTEITTGQTPGDVRDDTRGGTVFQATLNMHRRRPAAMRGAIAAARAGFTNPRTAPKRYRYRSHIG